MVLNALLGLGTASAPVFMAVFVGLGFWWGLPVLSTVLLALLLVTTMRLPLQVWTTVGGQTVVTRQLIPVDRSWIFVWSQSPPGGVAEVTVGGPFGVGDLADDPPVNDLAAGILEA